MTSGRKGALRLVGFGLVTLVFAVTRPFVLVGYPLVLLLIVCGPRSGKSAAVALAVVAAGLLGSPSGIWWFERGWPLLLAGTFVWMVALRPHWNFLAQALAALGMAAGVAGLILAVSPGAWLDLDAAMASRAASAAAAATALLGEGADDTVHALMQKVANLQVDVFPALLGLSSLGALGVVVVVRGWLGGERDRTFESLRNFRFNDHLVWIWLGGLALILAPLGEIATRVGSNAVLFMGLLYVLRGAAVLLSLVGGISVGMGVVGGIVALLLYPLLALLLIVTLLLGLSDTWLNVRSRTGSRGGDG